MRLGQHRAMDSNHYALETLVAERLTLARAEARRLDLLARARRTRPALRARLGRRLIALGEWLRGQPELVAARPR
jgi:hypothetical protein